MTVVLVNKITGLVGAAINTAVRDLGSETFESIGVPKVVFTFDDVAVDIIAEEGMAADFPEVTQEDLFVGRKLETVSDTAVAVVDDVSAETECIGELFAVTDSRFSETTFSVGLLDIGELTEMDRLAT